METHYKVLGVSRDATERDIRQAFEFQQKQCTAGSETAKRISAAYLTLSDPDRRREYDKALSEQRTGGPQAGHAGQGAVAYAIDLSEHPGDWAQDMQRAPTFKPVTEAALKKPPSPAPKDVSPLKKAWRGGYPLWIAFWGIGVLGEVLLNAVLSVTILAGAYTGGAPGFVRSIVIFVWIALAYWVFSSVAIWRSASLPGPHVFWRVAAKAIVIAPLFFAVLGILAAILIPAFLDLPKNAPYETEQIPAEVYRGYPEATIPPPASHIPPAATFTIDADLEQAAAYAVERYPFLDGNSPLVNHAAIDEVIALRDRFYSEGYSIGTALRMAVEIVGPRYANQSRPQ